MRQSKAGVYVQGAKKEPVSCYDDIKKVIDRGEKNRTLGKTAMNATSSRSHTVVTIDFTKVTKLAGKDGKTKSTINIVDLAGSEKQQQAKTEGIGLQEGNAINKSLTCLGNVIEALADISMGTAKKGRVVPYRDSVLTRMLQDALGGNSSTIMICAIRPGHLYYDETLATLRYADRAKKIQNKVEINEDPQAKLIRELKEENERLKAELAAAGGGGGSTGAAAAADPELARKLAEAEEQMRKNQEANDAARQKLKDSLVDQDQLL